MSAMLPAVSIQNQHKTCPSCQLILPQSQQHQQQAHCLKTKGPNDKTILSSQYPASQQRFTAIRQACLRALSSEHTFSDSTPMMFSDKAIGTAIVLIFQVEDGSSRGHVRKYALICLGENETKLMKYWSLIVPQLESIANSIKLRALMQLKKEESKNTGHERYLRKRELVSKSLVTILKDDKIFIELHSKFARILSMMT